MDIKLIRNTEDAVFKPINNGLVLQMVDDNYKFLDFIGKKLYILNSITNERYEISPEIKKYNIASIIYAHNTHDYVFYVSAEQITDSKADILLYRYSFDDNESTLVYRYEIDELEKIRQGNGTYSTLCPLWSAMPLGIGIPSGTRTFLVSSLLIDMALLI